MIPAGVALAHSYRLRLVALSVFIVVLPRVRADATQLPQLFQNLIGNAIGMPAGSGV